jgi:LysR family transcriptional regulator, nitrogen assimilation regulatory protein
VVAVSRERAMSAATKKLIEMIAEEATALISDGSWKTATLDLAPDIRKQDRLV